MAAAMPFGAMAFDAHAASPDAREPRDRFFSPPADLSWDERSRGRALDTDGLTLQFDSTFNNEGTLNTISADGGAGPWFAPIHSQVGKAEFRSPDYDPSPFSIVDGMLRIRCEQVNGVRQTGAYADERHQGEWLRPAARLFRDKVQDAECGHIRRLAGLLALQPHTVHRSPAGRGPRSTLSNIIRAATAGGIIRPCI